MGETQQVHVPYSLQSPCAQTDRLLGCLRAWLYVELREQFQAGARTRNALEKGGVRMQPQLNDCRAHSFAKISMKRILSTQTMPIAAATVFVRRCSCH